MLLLWSVHSSGIGDPKSQKAQYMWLLLFSLEELKDMPKDSFILEFLVWIIFSLLLFQLSSCSAVIYGPPNLGDDGA